MNIYHIDSGKEVDYHYFAYSTYRIKYLIQRGKALSPEQIKEQMWMSEIGQMKLKKGA